MSASKTISANAAKAVTAMLARLRALHPEDDGKLRRLRLSTDARKLLEQVKRKLTIAANAALPPLADVYADAPLWLRSRRCGICSIMLSSDADQLPPEIENDAMQRAVDFVEQYALPLARNVLGPASIDPVQRDARRLLSFAQQDLEPEQSVRELFRHLWSSMGQWSSGRQSAC